MTTNIGDLQIQDDFIVTISGTVINVREDEFLLQDATGEVWVDAYGISPGSVDVAVGEQVTVVGDMDDAEDFDARQITRVEGSSRIGQPLSSTASLSASHAVSNSSTNVVSAPLTSIGELQIRDDYFVTISGTVIDVREDEFLLQDATGEVWVDAYEISRGSVNLTVGEQVTVLGDMDDAEDFDALQITRADGLEVIGRPFPSSSGSSNSGSVTDSSTGVVLAPWVNIGDLQIRDDYFVTIGGAVTAVREDEFLLQDATGEVWVDAYGISPGFVDVAVGEQITVVGDMDDAEDFDALQIIQADGSEVIGRSTSASLLAGDWDTSNSDLLHGASENDVLVGNYKNDSLTGNVGSNYYEQGAMYWDEGTTADVIPANDVINSNQIFYQSSYGDSNASADYALLQSTELGAATSIEANVSFGDPGFSESAILTEGNAYTFDASHSIV